MTRERIYGPLLAAILGAGALAAGCGSEPGMRLANEAPNTRISSGPPEMSDTSFNVNLFWFGWDNDGFIDRYEIAWDDTTEWVTPIFTVDSLFVVEAADTCCVDPLPDYPPVLPDSVYEQFHTFFVRAVDNEGVPDPTPAFRSFNAKTIAPFTSVTFGPLNGQIWGSNVEFEWSGEDDDGVVEFYRYALVDLVDFRNDKGFQPETQEEIIDWVDTLTFFPLPGGGYSSERVWRRTETDSVVFPSLPPVIAVDAYVFAVRATDNAGAEERIMNAGQNVRIFTVRDALSGPRVAVFSNILGTWRSGTPSPVREVFAGEGIRFNWRATPGPSEAAVAGYSYSVEDSSNFSPLSINSTVWPPDTEEGEEVFWFPDPGFHSFFVKAVDEAGFSRTQSMRIQVFPGPRSTPAQDRFILVVLDTNPGTLQLDGIWPPGYESLERGMVNYLLEGYRIQVHETREGEINPRISLMNDASTVIWIHSAAAGSDIEIGASTLAVYHSDPSVPNPLPSYLGSGGNLLICGVAPSRAVKYFEQEAQAQPEYQRSFPINFQSTVTDTTFVPHWFASRLGIRRIDFSVDVPDGRSDPNALGLARSLIAGGNPYPDLPFDVLTWPQGPRRTGFGYVDQGFAVSPTGGAEAIYALNETNQAVAVRRLISPGVNGNYVVMGFHPYFVEKAAFRRFLRAALDDFGEIRFTGRSAETE